MVASRTLPADDELWPLDRTPAGGRVSDQVFTELVAAIRELRIKPGAVLSETDLSRRLGVSRTPVREAIGRLVEAGLLTVLPQVGTRVALISISEVRDAQFVREHLEIAAFAKASEGSAADAGFNEALRLQQLAVDAHDFDSFFAADEMFHRELFVAAGHPKAWDSVLKSKIQLDRMRRLASRPTALSQLVEEHRQIAAAVLLGNQTSGLEVLVKHVRRVLDGTEALRTEHPELFSD